MARVQNGGSGAEAADRAFLSSVQRLSPHPSEVVLNQKSCASASSASSESAASLTISLVAGLAQAGRAADCFRLSAHRRSIPLDEA